MTNDEFLDAEKKRGHIIYICDKCDYRGYGASVMYHEANHAGHTCISEDGNKVKKFQPVLNLDKMPTNKTKRD